LPAVFADRKQPEARRSLPAASTHGGAAMDFGVLHGRPAPLGAMS